MCVCVWACVCGACWEVVQTFILADFWCGWVGGVCVGESACRVRALGCDSRHDNQHMSTRARTHTHTRTHSFYYVKSYAEGSGVIHLAAGIV